MGEEENKYVDPYDLDNSESENGESESEYFGDDESEYSESEYDDWGDDQLESHDDESEYDDFGDDELEYAEWGDDELEFEDWEYDELEDEESIENKDSETPIFKPKLGVIGFGRPLQNSHIKAEVDILVPQIIELEWRDAEGKSKIDELPRSGNVTLWAKVINVVKGEEFSFIINKGKKREKEFSTTVLDGGILKYQIEVRELLKRNKCQD